MNIIQVTVYSFTLLQYLYCRIETNESKILLFHVTRIFLATTAHCHDWAAIKIHITHFTRIFNEEF